MAVAFIPFVGMAIPMVIVPMVLFAKHLGRARHYRHLERMQALKAGLAPPSTVPLPGPFAVVAIGVGVPMVCVVGALAGMSSMPPNTRDLPEMMLIIWIVAGLLALCGLATSLALGLLLHRANAREAAAARDPSAKPAAYDPDMFDAVHRDH